MIPRWARPAHVGLHGGGRRRFDNSDRIRAPFHLKAVMIAIVDDDEAVRVATLHLVHALGYETQAFASAEEFLQSPAQSQWSCVISDVTMPGLNGLELQRRLVAQVRNIPFIFVTAFPD